MALGNEIVLTAEPRGTFLEGFISGTPKPGTIMEIKPNTAPVGGRFTWQVYQPGTNGKRRLIAVLLPDQLQGKTATDAYANGDRGFLYCPVPGEELNVLVKNIAGTGDVFNVGSRFIVESGTGMLIITAGTPESEPFICLEAIGPLTDHTLVRCMATGY